MDDCTVALLYSKFKFGSGIIRFTILLYSGVQCNAVKSSSAVQSSTV